ncbi:hypothetical protein UT300018_10560 [Clostridium faecium]
MEKKYCPFIKDVCRDDCVFKYHNVACPSGKVQSCLIAVQLYGINDMQRDQLENILYFLKNEGI